MASILVIDDEENVRDVLQIFFKKKGYTVFTAPDGRAGLNVCKEMPVDVVITDIVMPEMEGLETIREIKKQFPCTKIVAISGGGQIEPESYLQMAKRLGAQRVFTKPFDLNAMHGAIEDLLQESTPA